MEAPKRTLHPLLAAAAVSVIVFSAVGVAAVTGLIPISKGSAKEETPVAAAEAAAPAPAPEDVAPAVEPSPAPAPRPVAKKHVAKAHKPTQVAAVETPAMTPPPPPPPVAQAPAPKPEPAAKPGVLGTVQAVREVTQDGSANGIGAVAGGAVVALLVAVVAFCVVVGAATACSATPGTWRSSSSAPTAACWLS